MRNPAQSVTRVPGWEHTGWRLSRLLNDEVSRSPALTQALDAMTSEKDRDSAVPALQEQLEKAGLRVAAAMAASLGRPQAASTLGPTGWRWQLLEAILIHAGDPDVDVARWLDGHTPLGIKSEIIPRGIFPRTEQTAAQLASWEFYRGRISEDIEENYASYKENAQESAGELSRLIREGHVEPIGAWADVKPGGQMRWPRSSPPSLKLGPTERQKSGSSSTCAAPA